MLDRDVLLRQERDEVPQGTLSCLNRNMATNPERGYVREMRLHTSRSELILIQRTLIVKMTGLLLPGSAFKVVAASSAKSVISFF